MKFLGNQLRIARTFNSFSLEEVAQKVGKTKQYIHKLEAGQAEPTTELSFELAEKLNVLPKFFLLEPVYNLSEDNFHFRKLYSTKTQTKQTAISKGDVFGRLVQAIEKEIKFPSVIIPEFSNATTPEEIEDAADYCRNEWGLGIGPISNMTRLAENIGAIVTNFQGLSREVDALSVALHRPVIVRNDYKKSVCRQRFDIAHEIGHFVLHAGKLTGDRVTENQANRFSSSLIIPRSMMLKFFPKTRNNRLDWRAISEFKLEWKLSKAALLYRARQLELINDQQYKSGFITLKRTGEAIEEKEDYLISSELPEILFNSLSLLMERKNISIDYLASSIGVKRLFLEDFLPNELLINEPVKSNVIPFPKSV